MKKNWIQIFEIKVKFLLQLYQQQPTLFILLKRMFFFKYHHIKLVWKLG